MIYLESVKDYIQGCSYKEIVRIQLAYIFLYILLMGFLIFRHFSALQDAQQKMKILNKARNEIQFILTEFEYIKNKTEQVDLLLTKDKNFYIQKYYQETMQDLDIIKQSASGLASNIWPNGYTEESLQINLSEITMKQLSDFLQAIQENQRVFVKNLEIVKSSVEKKINANLAIATLKPVGDKTSSAR